MQNPKQHHFVPKWYLQGFTDPNSGFLHIYDRKTRKYRTQKPDKVMRINKYYKQEWAQEGIDPNILERLAGEWIEPQAKNAFERLLKMPNDFTLKETAFILLYLESFRSGWSFPACKSSIKPFLNAYATITFASSLSV